MSRWHQQFSALGISYLRSTTAGMPPLNQQASQVAAVQRQQYPLFAVQTAALELPENVLRQPP